MATLHDDVSLNGSDTSVLPSRVAVEPVARMVCLGASFAAFQRDQPLLVVANPPGPVLGRFTCALYECGPWRPVVGRPGDQRRAPFFFRRTSRHPIVVVHVPRQDMHLAPNRHARSDALFDIEFHCQATTPYLVVQCRPERSAATLAAMIEAILNRRSVRWGFDGEPISSTVVDRIVACGLSAPSSKNAQPWRIHVVDDRALLGEIADEVRAGHGRDSYVPIDPATGQSRDWSSTVVESADVLAQVSLGLFVENNGAFSAGRRTVAAAEDAYRVNALVGYGFEMVGLGAAIQSMWLAAGDLGLAGVFMGDVLIAEDAIRERLGFVGDLVGVLALGHTTGTPTPKAQADGRVVRH